jgi:plasmid stabilization system protein ParE
MASYEISPGALDDLLNIEEFVSADSPAAGERLTDDFFQAFAHLQT